MLFFSTFSSSKNAEKLNEAAQLFSTLIIIRNAPNLHIIMISEGSCDTEDCSNEADTAINYILKYIQIEKRLFNLVMISHNISLTIFLIKLMQPCCT